MMSAANAAPCVMSKFGPAGCGRVASTHAHAATQKPACMRAGRVRKKTPFTSLLSFLLSLPAAAAGTEADEPPDEGGASRPRLARENGDAGAPALEPAVRGP